MHPVSKVARKEVHKACSPTKEISLVREGTNAASPPTKIPILENMNKAAEDIGHYGQGSKGKSSISYLVRCE